MACYKSIPAVSTTRLKVEAIHIGLKVMNVRNCSHRFLNCPKLERSDGCAW